MSQKNPEVYCSLIDSVFLPQLLCLYSSLCETAPAFHLFVVCVDDEAVKALNDLELPFVTTVPVKELETPRLSSLRAGRTPVEYCWTLTPFTFDRVFELAPYTQRVTYLDADMFFLADASELFGELERSGKDVLITEHAYAPEYDQTITSGRFCVQFVTFTRSDRAREVRTWWQDRCVEWCYNRFEDGKFGDQKYLDSWPSLFGDAVHVLQRRELALAPWNVRMFAKATGTVAPVFFHFHGLRLVTPRWLRCWWGYKIGSAGRRFYDLYVERYKQQRATLASVGFEPKPTVEIKGLADVARSIRNLVTGKTFFTRV